jgi:hypothetical protein
MVILTAGHSLERIFKRYGRERKELKREVLGAPPLDETTPKE